MKLSELTDYRTFRAERLGGAYRMNASALQPMAALALALVSDASHVRGKLGAEVQKAIRSAIDNADDSNVDSYHAATVWAGEKPTRAEFWSRMFDGSLSGLLCERDVSDKARAWFKARGITG